MANTQSLASRLFAPGITAYREQCAHGGVLLEKAKPLMGDYNAYVFPPTPRDQDAYGDPSASTTAFYANIIVARLRTADNQLIFRLPQDKKDALKILTSGTVSNLDVKELTEEILAAYGEYDSGAKDDDSDNDDDESIAAWVKADDSDPAPRSAGSPDILLPEAQKPREDTTHHTPTFEQAVGN